MIWPLGSISIVVEEEEEEEDEAVTANNSRPNKAIPKIPADRAIRPGRGKIWLFEADGLTEARSLL